MRPTLVFLVFTCCAALALLSSPATANQKTHTIVQGDTLWSIAARNHVSVGSLEARNHLTDSSVLRLGSVLLIDAPPETSHNAGRSNAGAASFSSPGQAPLAPLHRRGKPGARDRRLPGAASFSSPTERGRGAPSLLSLAPITRNALWMATHSGQAPPAPGARSFALVERILAFDAAVTHTALRYLGVPYVWGGTSFSGVDCSGFVQAVFERNGISLPRTADSQFEVGRAVRTADLRPGDLVFFETYSVGASHVGIYLGGGRFIHASSSDGVRIDNLSQDYYSGRYLGARRLIH